MQQIKKEAKVPANAESKMYVYLNQSIYSSPCMYITQTNRHLHSDVANKERSKSSGKCREKCICIYLHIYIYTHVYIYIYMFTHTRTGIYTQMQQMEKEAEVPPWERNHHRLQIRNFGMYIHVHVTQTKESCHTPSTLGPQDLNLQLLGPQDSNPQLWYGGYIYTWHIWRRHVMSNTWKTHVTHMKESCHTREWVMWHMWRRRITHMIVSGHTCEWIAWHM